jgi:2-polyprenyl-3-methyl-5-hydroxy-6-metoxy-1,4-benzoquinol methylase
MRVRDSGMKVAILVVAYNAKDTLAQVLARVPPEVMERVSEVAVFDDASVDTTYEAGVAYKERTSDPKLNIYRNERNLGYGGNQKRGYTYCIRKGYDAVVLLHGDGQYAPEVMGELLDTLEREQADAVFGSRMMVRGAARRGGMPLYKYVGNKILSWFENRMLHTRFTEFHSGYRVYRCQALARVPYELNTDDFHFDTQIIIQFIARGLKTVEHAIPTYYGDEICYVNGMKYAWDVAWSVVRYRLHKWGLIYEARYDLDPEKYVYHATRASSHGQIIALTPPNSRVLDLGCGPGHVAEHLREKGCTVVGVDRNLTEAARARCDWAYECDLESAWPAELQSRRFDVVLLADVLEHLREPAKALARARAQLRPGGCVIASVPNAANAYVRLNLLLGRFEYAERGIMDRDHVRFFTRGSFLRALKAAGFRVTHKSVTPVPLASLHPPGKAPWFARAAERLAHVAARLWPGMFAYQFVALATMGEPGAAELPPGIGGVEEGQHVEQAQDVQQDEQRGREPGEPPLPGRP